nr:DNA-formamidopyrimidine glycosylase [Pseudomonadota bacterium]
MPELAEVETTRRGIEPYVCGQTIARIIIRHTQLRWAVPTEIVALLKDQQFFTVQRRGKYLLFHSNIGTLIIHLGMSGCLRIVDSIATVQKHDHIDIVFTNGNCLRFTDPRRFGSIHWTTKDPLQHKLLAELGPEPLVPAFSAKYLEGQARNRTVPIKTFIMNSHIVVG